MKYLFYFLKMTCVNEIVFFLVNGCLRAPI